MGAVSVWKVLEDGGDGLGDNVSVSNAAELST